MYKGVAVCTMLLIMALSMFGAFIDQYQDSLYYYLFNDKVCRYLVTAIVIDILIQFAFDLTGERQFIFGIPKNKSLRYLLNTNSSWSYFWLVRKLFGIYLNIPGLPQSTIEGLKKKLPEEVLWNSKILSFLGFYIDYILYAIIQIKIVMSIILLIGFAFFLINPQV